MAHISTHLPGRGRFLPCTYFCSTERSHAGRQALQAGSPTQGNPLPSALPLARLRALFWKSHPPYLGRETQLPSPTIHALSHTTIHQKTVPILMVFFQKTVFGNSYPEFKGDSPVFTACGYFTRTLLFLLLLHRDIYAQVWHCPTESRVHPLLYLHTHTLRYLTPSPHWRGKNYHSKKKSSYINLWR